MVIKTAYRKLKNRNRNIGVWFLPFIIETTGGFSKAAYSFCAEIKSRNESLNYRWFRDARRDLDGEYNRELKILELQHVDKSERNDTNSAGPTYPLSSGRMTKALEEYGGLQQDELMISDLTDLKCDSWLVMMCAWYMSILWTSKHL